MTTALTFSPSPRSAVRTAPRRVAASERAFDPSGLGIVYWTSTARSALRAILLHLRESGQLADESSEVLVPRWVCLAFYNTLQKVCFPTLQGSSALRGVVVYHQYGFPQRLDLIAQRCRDRGLFLIENCVNCAFDRPSPHGMGETGLASIFSLPKMYRTVLGGALVTRDPSLKAFCDPYFREDESWIGRLSRVARRINESPLRLCSPRFHEMIYALSDYGRRALPSDIVLLERDFVDDAIARRKANYARLRHEFSDTPFFTGLEPDVIPYAVPLFGPPEFLSRLATRLSERGWESGIYHFDAARNVFEPDFVPCVPLPIHQGLTRELTDTLIETICSEWRTYNGQR